MNYMALVFCPKIQGPFWANYARKPKDLRCCKCGQTGHSKISDKSVRK